MITIENNFHHTMCRLRASVGDVLIVSQVKRCRKVLCGIPGCTCGGELGERGPQSDDSGHRFYVLPISPYEVELIDEDLRCEATVQDQIEEDGS